MQLAMIDTTEDLEVVRRRIVLPYRPVSKNVWDGWQPMWKSGARKKWQKALHEQFAEQQFPIGAVTVGVAARLWFASNRRRDWQNYVHPLWYFVADALVQYGVVADDTPEYFEAGPNGGVEFMIDRRNWVPVKQRSRTELAFAIRTV